MLMHEETYVIPIIHSDKKYNNVKNVLHTTSVTLKFVAYAEVL